MNRDFIRVLLIEDDEIERLGAVRHFERNVPDMELTAVATVDEARQALQHNGFEAVVTDYALRGETGFDVLDLDGRMPKIFLTGRGDEEIAVRALKMGAYDYVVKDAESGHLTLLPIILKNAIRRKRAEQALRLVQFENSVAGVVRFEPRGPRFDANNHFAALLGYDDVASLKAAREENDPHLLRQLETLNECTRLRGQLDNEQIEFVDVSGRKVLTLVSAGTYLAEAGDNVILEASLVDVSDLRRAERERERLREQLQQAQKMDALGTLAGGMAHDFNNLLSVIVGYTDLARAELAEEHPVQESLGHVKTACGRARDLVRHIVTFSRQSRTQRRNVHLRPIVEEALQLLRPGLPSGIDLKVQLGHDDDVVSADAGQIGQVVINLCQNAVHAMADSGGVLEVDLGCRAVDGVRRTNLAARRCAVLTVRDNGGGIDEDSLQRIFDPFFTTKPEGEGTGLGLSVVNGIVRDHDGTIEVNSERGRGTTMTIWWPLSEGRIERAEPVQGSIPRGDERVLLVDDEEPVRQLMMRVLDSLGYQVTSCESAGDALRELESSSFDAIITDFRMPYMDGTQFVRAMRDRGHRTPAIVLSGTQDKELQDEAAFLGVARFVAKPVTLSQIAEAVRAVIDDAPERDKTERSAL